MTTEGRNFLETVGSKIFDVYLAADAVEATNIIIRKNMDVILLDIKMSRVDGRQLWDIINEYDPGLKIIVASVYPVEKQKRMIPNAANYYDKSQGMMMLLEKVTNALV